MSLNIYNQIANYKFINSFENVIHVIVEDLTRCPKIVHNNPHFIVSFITLIVLILNKISKFSKEAKKSSS